MMYNCHFPGCSYETEFSSSIDHHHITPLEVDPNSKATIDMCKNHHNFIFHPESKYGQHSVNTPECIQILNIFNSTGGNALYYQDFGGKKFYYFFNNKAIIEA